jgi:hypothetical protein
MNGNNCILTRQNKMNCELMLTYDTPALRQTGSRNLTAQKTLPTICGTYMKLVTKYQISAINSCKKSPISLITTSSFVLKWLANNILAFTAQYESEFFSPVSHKEVRNWNLLKRCCIWSLLASHFKTNEEVVIRLIGDFLLADIQDTLSYFFPRNRFVSHKICVDTVQNINSSIFGKKNLSQVDKSECLPQMHHKWALAHSSSCFVLLICNCCRHLR